MSPNNQQKISLMDFTEPLSRIPDGVVVPDNPNGSLLYINFTVFFFFFFFFFLSFLKISVFSYYSCSWISVHDKYAADGPKQRQTL